MCVLDIENGPTECPNCGNENLDAERDGVEDYSWECDACDWSATTTAETISVYLYPLEVTNRGRQIEGYSPPRLYTDPGPLLPGLS